MAPTLEVEAMVSHGHEPGVSVLPLTSGVTCSQLLNVMLFILMKGHI